MSAAPGPCSAVIRRTALSRHSSSFAVPRRRQQPHKSGEAKPWCSPHGEVLSASNALEQRVACSVC